MKTNNVIGLIGAIVICELAGIIGAIFTTPAITTWYATLTKPEFTPPGWVFGPIWTTLFFLMGIALFLVWRKGLSRKEVKIALIIFIVQLVLNVFWSIIFFGLHSPGWAMVEIVILWLSILATMLAFGKVSKAAMWLLLPYILWVTCAGILNYSIWQLNSVVNEPVACTMEAKICQDGSAVGRSGSKCEFTPCPSVIVPTGWTTFTDAKNGVSFNYPKQLSTKYIDTATWPPKVSVSIGPFTCTETGSAITATGKTEKRTVNDRDYCVTAMSEGAAGSTYTTYTYAFAKDGKIAILTFALRAVQCDNYDEPQKTECKNERATFNVDTIADEMAQSLKL